MKKKNRSQKKKGGCGCNTAIPPQSGGAGFVIPPTSNIPPSYTLSPDSTLPQIATRMQIKGGRRVRKQTCRPKKHKRKGTKKNKGQQKFKVQKGGVNLGFLAQNSTFGHGHYGAWFGAPTTSVPEWNASIFTKPTPIHSSGYNEHNPYLV
jgi:hypothetical protein